MLNKIIRKLMGHQTMAITEAQAADAPNWLALANEYPEWADDIAQELGYLDFDDILAQGDWLHSQLQSATWVMRDYLDSRVDAQIYAVEAVSSGIRQMLRRLATA